MLLHLGQRNFAFSYSEIVIMRVNFFLHLSHLKSYEGIAKTSSDQEFSGGSENFTRQSFCNFYLSSV